MKEQILRALEKAYVGVDGTYPEGYRDGFDAATKALKPFLDRKSQAKPRKPIARRAEWAPKSTMTGPDPYRAWVPCTEEQAKLKPSRAQVTWDTRNWWWRVSALDNDQKDGIITSGNAKYRMLAEDFGKLKP
jgi:hypothetical protein